MRQKSTRDAFFCLRNEPQLKRPASVATEFMDTDWDEEITSEAEENSPRVSLQSVSINIITAPILPISLMPLIPFLITVWPTKFYNNIIIR